MKRLIWFLMIGGLFLGGVRPLDAQNAIVSSGNDRSTPTNVVFQNRSCCFLHSGGLQLSIPDAREKDTPPCRCQPPSREKANNAFCSDESRQHPLRGYSIDAANTESLHTPNDAVGRIINPILKHPLYLQIARFLI